MKWTRKLTDVIFEPRLWMLPFLALIVMNVWQIARHGVIDARQPFVEYRQFHSFNVILFSFLWMWGITLFTALGHRKTMVIYLAFCLIFSAYGAGELIHRFLWADVYIGYYGVLSWLLNFGYPLFFVFHNAPLFMNGNVWRGRSMKVFAALITVSAALYAVTYLFDKQRRLSVSPVTTYELSWWRIPADSVYFAARTLTVAAYMYLFRRHN